MTLLSVELLEHARVSYELGTQAGLRRAVSSAYYAVFHLLCDAVAERFAPGAELKSLRPHLRRSLEHGSMKIVAKRVSELGPRPPRSPGERTPRSKPDRPPVMVGIDVTADLADVAGAFVDLQARRHDADYNLSITVSKAEASRLVQLAKEAFTKWEKIKDTPGANAFLMFLMLGARRRE